MKNGAGSVKYPGFPGMLMKIQQRKRDKEGTAIKIFAMIGNVNEIINSSRNLSPLISNRRLFNFPCKLLWEGITNRSRCRSLMKLSEFQGYFTDLHIKILKLDPGDSPF